MWRSSLWRTSAAALSALLLALPTDGVRITADEVVHFAMSQQDCTSTCGDDAVCEVDGKSKFTERVSTRAVCGASAGTVCLPSHCASTCCAYTKPVCPHRAFSLAPAGDPRPSRNQALCLVLSRRVTRAAQGCWRGVSAIF